MDLISPRAHSPLSHLVNWRHVVGLDDKAFEEEVAKLTSALTGNQRAVWRACFTKGHAKSFVISARAAGATHALFVVDAHTAPEPISVPGMAVLGSAARKGPDLARPLTDRGSAQCMNARELWYGRLPVRSVMFASPARRSAMTAGYMAGGVSGKVCACESRPSRCPNPFMSTYASCSPANRWIVLQYPPTSPSAGAHGSSHH